MLKKIFFFLLIICAVGAVSAQADFTISAPGGQVVSCHINPDGATVSVTHPSSQWPYYKPSQRPVGELILPDSVVHNGRVYPIVSIGRNAFYNCDSLTSITLGRHVRSIGTQAFNGCTSLSSLSLNDSLHAIGEGAFAYCRSLDTLVLPVAVDSIGISAFAICSSLVSVYAPQSAIRAFDATTFWGYPLPKITPIFANSKKQKK